MLLAGIGGLGAPELLIILVIVVVLFGASRLGSLGRELGTGIKEFKKATRDPQEEERQRRAAEERRRAEEASAAAATTTPPDPATNGTARPIGEYHPGTPAVTPPAATNRPPDYTG